MGPAVSTMLPHLHPLFNKADIELSTMTLGHPGRTKASMKGAGESKNWDFYLQANAAYGIRRPKEFDQVINAIQDLMHKLSYSRYRATKAVSIYVPACCTDILGDSMTAAMSAHREFNRAAGLSRAKRQHQ